MDPYPGEILAKTLLHIVAHGRLKCAPATAKRATDMGGGRVYQSR
jgi:hypothetical protein